MRCLAIQDSSFAHGLLSSAYILSIFLVNGLDVLETFHFSSFRSTGWSDVQADVTF